MLCACGGVVHTSMYACMLMCDVCVCMHVVWVHVLWHACVVGTCVVCVHVYLRSVSSTMHLPSLFKSI